MDLLTLYVTFLKIGAFAFGGGYAVLPLITQYVVDQQGWLSAKELTDLVSLSQMTPGPIAINSATFIGTKVAGIPGAIVATLGNVTPQFILMMLLGYVLFTKEQEMPWLTKLLKGLKPAVVGLVAIATLDMIEASLFTTGAWSLNAWSIGGLIGFVMGLIFYARKKLGVIGIVILCAGSGLLLHAIGVM